MILPVNAICEHKSGGLLRKRTCGVEATGQCVYCARTFCDAHGVHGEEYHQVCERAACRARYDDLFAHRDWVARQQHENLAGYCATEGCENAPDIGCERCRLRFCPDHLRPRTVQEGDLDRVVLVQQMLCPHCSDRRKLWES